jgi:hypothetical protein
VAALTQKRLSRSKQSTTRALPATAATYYQGALICWDTSVGRVCKGRVATTLRPIGLCAVDKVIGTNGDPLEVVLFRELTTHFFANLRADAVVAADCGGLCYIASDREVAHSDNANARSVLGVVWSVDALKGVEVEPRFSDSRLGGLDA